jgi:CDP-diglyceride synthetase
VISTQLCLDYLTRRKANFIMSICGLIFLFLLRLEEYDKDSLIYSSIYFGFRLVVSSGNLIIYNTDYESFPTQIRAVGSTLAYLFGNASGIIQPYLVSAWKQQGWNVLYSLMIVVLISLIPNYFIKETYGIPPPEIIEELSPDAKLKQD